ncbi:glycosyltransferase family 87 protein [Sphingobacterium sp. Mn56C]|uniref:glycosyltransferase family 87 protein n=1 Tax=Sphingobacterium sp. Mn56C TaxID=3395261 RepID=UPI003BE5A0C2
MKIRAFAPLRYNPKYLYYFGLLVTLVLTFLEFSKGRHQNFIVFADSSRDFWKGISPYTDEWVTAHGRFFLYTPIFSVLFSPFAFLPAWLGPFAWNIFNYSLFFLAIFKLPPNFSDRQKCNMFLFTLLILGQSLLSFQYNVTVAYIFLFAYSLMERKQFFWAIVLIMISGTTKVYGIFQLGLLLCYPQLWRNMGYVLLTGALLFLLPLLKLTTTEFLPYYGEWLYSLSSHHSTQVFDSIYYITPLSEFLLPHYRTIQLGALGILAILLIVNRKKYNNMAFRAQALAVLMGWTILFSDAAERHTYVIALAGYMLWYWSRSTPLLIDKILFWAAFFFLCIVPIDIFVPKPVMNIICYTLWLNVWTFLIIWLRMVWTTFLSPTENRPLLY